MKRKLKYLTIMNIVRYFVWLKKRASKSKNKSFINY